MCPTGKRDSDSPLGPVPAGWTLVRLSDISVKIGSGATPKGGESAYIPTRQNFALIRSQNVFDRHFEPAGLAFISDEQAAELRNATAQECDILLNITGDGVTFGRSCLAPRDVLPACVNQHVSIVRLDTRVAEPGYVVSFLTHPAVKHYIESFNAGGSRRAITKGHIESFQIPLPPVPEQREMAQLLSTFDHKIESNSRMNETLETMARAIFKSWFVDFDPVRAKAEGRQPYCMDTSTAAVFADSFEDSPLGELPKGWRAGKLDDLIAIYGGGTPNTSVREFWDGTIPWFSVVDAPRPSDVFVINTEKRITEAGVENSSAKILPAGTIVISARGTVGRLAMLGRPMAINQSCYGIRPKNGSGERFTFFCLKHKIAELSQSTHGTVFDTITRDTFRIVPCVIPPDTVIQRFEEAVAPFLERIHFNVIESKTLSDIRDVLLPTLLSGTIRVAPRGHAEVAQP